MNLFRRAAAANTALVPPATVFAGIGSANEQAAAPAAASAAAEEETECETEDMEKPGKTGKKGKKAKEPAAAAENDDDEKDPDDCDDEDGDDDSDERDMRNGSSSKACRARRRERARISSILAHASENTIGYAAHIALNTNLPRSQAISLLKNAPLAAATSGLSQRMANAPRAPSPETALTDKERVDAGWASAFAKHAITAKKT